MTDIVFFDGDNLVPCIVDAVLEERHGASSDATEDEVEVGVSITDHVKPKRRSLLLRVVVSDTPVGQNDAVTGSDQPFDLELPRRRVQAESTQSNGQVQPGAIRDDIPAEVFGVMFQPDSEPTRIADTWRILMDARARALLCIITTTLDTYDDMVLTNIETTRTNSDGTVIVLDLSFVEVRQVATQLVNDPVPVRARDRRQVNRGAQQPTPPANGADLDSNLHQAGTFVRQALGL